MNAQHYWMMELVNRSDTTRRKYQRYFNKFCQFLDLSSDEILARRQQDLKADDIRARRYMESQLKQFIAALDDEGFSISTQQVAYAAVRSFFEQNYIPLAMRRGDYPRGESLGHRALTKDEIRQMLEEANIDQQAAIMILKDTGLRVSDVVRLTLGHLEPGLGRGDPFIPIAIVTKKNKVAAKPFIGPEAIHAINRYLEQRRRGTRRLPPEDVGPDSPLLRAHVGGEIRPLTRSGLSSAMSLLSDRIGVNGDVSAHSFRKYFQTRLESAGVPPTWVDRMVGRRLQGVYGHYSLPSDQELFEKYQASYDALRVYEVGPTPHEVKALRARITELESQLQEVSEKMKLRDLPGVPDGMLERFFADPEVEAFFRRKIREQLRDDR